MKKLLIIMFVAAFIVACGNSNNNQPEDTTPPKSMIPDKKVDDGKGIGEIKNVKLNNPLDQEQIAKGQAIYDLKCAACHKLSSKRVVGPGFEKLTERRKPEWIMNMITNTGVMLDEDPVAQKMLEECLTRMPNQNVSIADARDLLEFFYDNDTKK